EQDAETIEQEATETIERAVEFADDSPAPEPEDLFTDAYSTGVANAPGAMPGDRVITLSPTPRTGVPTWPSSVTARPATPPGAPRCSVVRASSASARRSGRSRARTRPGAGRWRGSV